MSLSETWGTTPGERERHFPCDASLARIDAQLYRGITINAAPEVVFRWLCQLRVAPYSYDWIDNGGRQSPQELTPGLERLKIGQDVMTIFTLTSFDENKHLTIRLKPSRTAGSVFGDVAVSYLIVPEAEATCRLLVKVVVRNSHTLKGRFMRRFLPWGDLVMMRKQLINLKRLAETPDPSTQNSTKS
ncbi:MAG: SRPBCC family protein [Acidobacteriota bacterium]|nr:SRPBCC family protein [Acidobacteriota bacterium]